MLGYVIYLAMTESALILYFDVLLPKHLGAVMFLSYCSQNIWEQSYVVGAVRQIGEILC